jgi:hypothetical protein
VGKGEQQVTTKQELMAATWNDPSGYVVLVLADFLEESGDNEADFYREGGETSSEGVGKWRPNHRYSGSGGSGGSGGDGGYGGYG